MKTFWWLKPVVKTSSILKILLPLSMKACNNLKIILKDNKSDVHLVELVSHIATENVEGAVAVRWIPLLSKLTLRNLLKVLCIVIGGRPNPWNLYPRNLTDPLLLHSHSIHFSPIFTHFSKPTPEGGRMTLSVLWRQPISSLYSDERVALTAFCSF